MPLTVEEIKANIKKREESPYREIQVFKADAVTLAQAVERIEAMGDQTDIPCIIQSLIDGYLEKIIEEDY